MQSQFKDKKVIATLVLPGIIIMLFAIVAPLIISLGLSFVKWSGFGSIKFVGFKNYIRLAHDTVFYKSILNVVLLTVITIFIQNVIAFLIAIALSNLKQKLSTILRTIYFIPATLSLVVVAKLWVNIFDPNYGLFNKLLSKLVYGDIHTVWLGNPKTAIWAIIWIICWQGFGWALLFFYSGIVTVPQELKEAAVIDGANRATLYTKIIVPYLLPIIEAIVIVDVTSSLKQMDIIYLSTAGGPGNTTQFIALYLYQRAFKYSEYGYGNSISIIFVLLAFLSTLLIQRIFSKRMDY